MQATGIKKETRTARIKGDSSICKNNTFNTSINIILTEIDVPKWIISEKKYEIFLRNIP